MTFIQLIACIGMIAGAFILLGISPIAFTDGLFSFLIKRPKSIKYDTLMHTYVGQLILTICAAAIFISTAFVIKLTKPIEYRR